MCKCDLWIFGLLLSVLSFTVSAAQDWAWNMQSGYTGQVDLGSSGSVGALSTMVSGSANLAGNNAVQPPLVVNVQAGSTTSSGSLTPSDACLVFKQGTGWVVNGTSTVASVGYVCTDGTIYAGIASGQPFYVRASDIDGGFGMMWAGYGAYSNANYPTSRDAGGAVEACQRLGSGWSLPNRAQLSVMYTNKAAIDTAAATLPGGMSFASAPYWSSVEYASTNAWYLDFSSGAWNYNTKNLYYRVRCARSY